jgi:hypothetical protein
VTVPAGRFTASAGAGESSQAARRSLAVTAPAPRSGGDIECTMDIQNPLNAQNPLNTHNPVPGTTLSDDDVRACVRVLRAIEADRSHLTRLTPS